MSRYSVFVLSLIAESTRIEGALDTNEGPNADRGREEGVDVFDEGHFGGEGGRSEDKLERNNVDGGMYSSVCSSCSGKPNLWNRKRSEESS